MPFENPNAVDSSLFNQLVALQASPKTPFIKQNYIKLILVLPRAEQFLGKRLCSEKLTMKQCGSVDCAYSIMLLQHFIQKISPCKPPQNRITWLEILLNQHRQERNNFDLFALVFSPLNAALLS